MSNLEHATCDYCRRPYIPRHGEAVCAYCTDADEGHRDDQNDDRFDDEYRPDPIERAMGECGQTADGGCMLAGTEHCDWDCPFSH